MLRVSIADQQQFVPVDRGRLRQLVRRVLTDEGIHKAEITLALVDDATIHDLNRRFLNHDEPTDVLTFPMSGPDDPKLVGEIVVSVETARRVADSFGHPAENEVALYVVHGLLHLCEYDDHDPAERKKMRDREARHLRTLGIELKGSVDDE